MIAFRCAVYGKDTYIYDVIPAKTDEALRKIPQWLDAWVAKGRITRPQADEALRRVHATRSLAECVTDADVAIEVVPEIPELKQKVWADIDAAAPAKTYITTNTSSLKVSDFLGGVRRKDKTFSLNFTLPIEDDLVEAMWNPHTSEDTKALARAFLDSLELVRVETLKEQNGYSFNRIWRAIKKESLRIVDQGYCGYQDVDRAFMLAMGAKFGPFMLMDLAGLDVIKKVEETYYRESGDPSDKPPKVLSDLVEKGHLGVKTGQGFYKYPDAEYKRPGWLYRRDKAK
jgi:3-hydroxybutyryl-CoA dehydrogenase